MLENYNDYQIYYDLGLQLAKERRWQQAVKHYQKAIELQDNIAEIYHHYGDALINLKKWQQAVNVYRKAIALDNSFAWSYHNLGWALFNSGKYKQATNAYNKAIAINPSNSQFKHSLGKLLVSLGKLELAIDCYDKAIAIDNNKFELYHELGDIFSQLEQWDDAVGAYQKAIQLDRKATWSYHNLGVALLKLKLPQEAVTFLQQVISLDSNFVSGYYYLGEAFRLQQKWERAVTVYRRAIAIQPDYPNLQYALANSLEQRARADFNLAIDIYQRSLSTASKPGIIYQQIANILAEKQQLDQAIYYINRALKVEPKNTDYWAFLSRMCERRSKLYEPTPKLAHRQKDGLKIADHSYGLWSKYNSPSLEDWRLYCSQIKDISVQPVISIVLPLPKSARQWIEATITTIREQIYPHWQLYLVTTTTNNDRERYGQQEGSLYSILKSQAVSDRRIAILSGEDRLEFAELGNIALEKATGEWIAVLEPETLLTPNALLEFVWQLERDNTVDIVYGDEDKIKKGNLLGDPWFKPKWSPDLLLARNYFGSLVFCRHSLVRESSGFTKGYGNAYHYELFLRLTEKTQNIAHIPQILSHRQFYFQPDEQSIIQQIKAVTDTLQRRGETGKVSSSLEFPEIKTIRYQIDKQDLVSIIIPTRNLGKILDRCLSSIFELTSYSNYETILVDNGTDNPESLAIIERWQQKEPKRIKVIKLDVDFNYSWLNNRAVAESQGKYLLFLNNDTKIISSDWLEAMVEQAQRPTVGAVGALLLYPDDTIQHAGVILGVTGIAGHGHRSYPVSHTGYNYSLISTSNYSAVTSACLMCRREVFAAVGGFNERLAVAYNDVDFCLKLRQQGYYNVWLPHVKLYHYESQTRTPEDTPEKKERISKEIAYMERTWGEIINNDPYYNIHLTKETENYSLNLKCKAEITAIFLTEVSQEQLWGFFIDTPKPGCLQEDYLEIVGWVVGKIADAVTLEILYEGKIITVTDVDRSRPDVAIAYPDIPNAENSGFATQINVNDLPYEGELNLQIVLADNSKIRLGKIQLG